MTNEIRSDALKIKAFYRICKENLKCSVIEKDGPLITELKNKYSKLQQRIRQKMMKKISKNIHLK